MDTKVMTKSLFSAELRKLLERAGKSEMSETDVIDARAEAQREVAASADMTDDGGSN